MAEAKINSKVDTGIIKELVRLADVFVRIGARGPLEIELPLYTAIEIPGKGYRRMSFPSNTRLITEKIAIGKRDGLIFRFTPENELERNGEKVSAIECKWVDVCDAVPELYERLNDYYDGDAVKRIAKVDERLRERVDANQGMHKILSEGFKAALGEAKENFKQETVEGNELYGQWG